MGILVLDRKDAGFITQRVVQSFGTFAATFSSEGPTLGSPCFSSPSMRWQPQQPRPSTIFIPASSFGASGKFVSCVWQR